MASRERAGIAEVSVEAVESLIRDLPGILGARLVVNDWGGVREIHVLAEASRPAKSVVRDVESALMARWSLEVDHKRISVAQVVDAPRRPRAARLRVQRLTVATDALRGETEVAVCLAPAEEEERPFGRAAPPAEPAAGAWEGHARGDAGAGARLRLTVAATVAALNQALLPGHSFTLVDAAPATIGGHDVVNALIRYRGPRGTDQLVAGAAVVRGSGPDAGVRAALQATNRVAGVAMRRPGDEERSGADDRDDPEEEAAEQAAATQEPGDAGWPEDVT